jgi:hypothetical protein
MLNLEIGPISSSQRVPISQESKAEPNRTQELTRLSIEHDQRSMRTESRTISGQPSPLDLFGIDSANFDAWGNSIASPIRQRDEFEVGIERFHAIFRPPIRGEEIASTPHFHQELFDTKG